MLFSSITLSLYSTFIVPEMRLTETPSTPSKEEMDQMIEYFNQFISHYEEEYGKKYSGSDGDINPKEAYFHSLLGDL